MKALAVCSCEQVSRFPLGAIAPPPTLSCFAAAHHRSNADLLAIARQIAQTAQPSQWEAHQLEQYFGPESRSLQFKEIVLPIVWAARQQLIGRVGAHYHRLTLTQRSHRELKLLVTLNAALEQACKRVDTPKLLDANATPKIIFQMALSGIFIQPPSIILNVVEIASHWIDATVELLDSL